MVSPLDVVEPVRFGNADSECEVRYLTFLSLPNDLPNDLLIIGEESHGYSPRLRQTCSSNLSPVHPEEN